MEIYLQSFGSRLRVKDGLFEVTVPDLSGSNHHVTEQFAAHQVQSIFLQPGSSVSSDALLLAIEHGTDIMVLDVLGNPAGRFWSNRPSTTLAIWKNQLSISITSEALAIAKEWVEAKIRERLKYLKKLKGYRSGDKLALIEKAESSIADLLARLHALPVQPDTDNAAASIRGLEGTAGRIYLDTLSALLPEEYQFEGRSRRPATDMFNAFLNYGYGILYRIVERALFMAGIHPYIGFMHYDGYQRKSMVYDFVEPFRIWVEKTVFQLFAAKSASGKQVTPPPDNADGLWLNEEGKRLLTDALHERMRKKKKEYHGKRFALEQYVAEEARRFASFIMGWKLRPATAAAYAYA
ncbi:MAG: CRISPR-associated endonuclease Cas1 [Haliscomenobacteraceae bacterium CHB4]|nr:CRISPR-associated endonuclease Cas1 [Haliscomenobacteraceae bacterium CHB4]